MVTKYVFDEGSEYAHVDEDGDYVSVDDYEELESMLDIAWAAVEEAGYAGYSEQLREFMEAKP